MSHGVVRNGNIYILKAVIIQRLFLWTFWINFHFMLGSILLFYSWPSLSITNWRFQTKILFFCFFFYSKVLIWLSNKKKSKTILFTIWTRNNENWIMKENALVLIVSLKIYAQTHTHPWIFTLWYIFCKYARDFSFDIWIIPATENDWNEKNKQTKWNNTWNFDGVKCKF